MKPNPKYLSFYYQTMTEFPDIELDPKKTALLIIDMQNEFVRRDMGEALQFKEMGEWERWIPFHDRLDNVTIPACKKMLDYFRANNMYVTYGRIACLLDNGEDRCCQQGLPELAVARKHVLVILQAHKLRVSHQIPLGKTQIKAESQRKSAENEESDDPGAEETPCCSRIRAHLARRLRGFLGD